MRTYYLNPSIYNKMYAVMQYKNALALRVSLETALRIDDVLSLRPEQLEKRTLFGVASKTKKSFRKVISADLANRLREVAGKHYIFEGRLNPQKHRTRQAVWKDVKKAAAVLDLHGNIAPHSARKTYAVEHFKDGGLAQVKHDLQHTDINTTILYAFADYLDELPHTVTKKKRTDVREENNANEEKAPYLDGAFWETFADLVADKTAHKLMELARAR